MASCSFEGNTDLYGIGVRVGLYTQWGATLIVTLFNQDEEETFRIVNLLLQSAVFISLCQQGADHTSAVEPVITLFLLCGSLSSLTGDGITYFSHVSGIFRTLFYLALSAYSVWFWYTGVDMMLRPNCPEIAFFGRSAIQGWFRSLSKALSVIALITCVALVGISIYAIKRRFQNGLDAAFASTRNRRGRVDIALLLFSSGLIAFSVLVIEYLIRRNHVTGLDNLQSAGQLIPLLIGAMSLLIATWHVLLFGGLWRHKCWYVLGWHL